MRPLPNL